MKVCSNRKCKFEGKPQSLENFNKCYANNDDLQYWCKVCHIHWEKENPEKRTEYNRRWEKNNPEKAKAIRLKATKKWQKNNSEEHRKRVDKWRKNNPEKVSASSKKFRENNPEKIKAYREKYKKINPEAWNNWVKENLERRREIARNSARKRTKEKKFILLKYLIICKTNEQ